MKTTTLVLILFLTGLNLRAQTQPPPMTPAQAQARLWQMRLQTATNNPAGSPSGLPAMPAIPGSLAPPAGAPAPVAPTKNLVVIGLYRHVRNPIYVAVVAIILGQAMLFGDWRLVLLGALLWLAFHLFVVAYEEPTLQDTFGSEYEAYRANVRRWVPRVVAWRAPESG